MGAPGDCTTNYTVWGAAAAVAEVEAQVDQAAAELWGITPKELAEVQRNLAELRG